MSLKVCNKGSPFPPLQDTVLRIYSMRFCPYAQRTLLVLEHKNIPYEVVNIDLKDKPDWFLERNPVGTVPAIEKGEVVLYESTATSEWIDDTYPCPRLTPSDPFIKGQDRMLLEYYSKLSGCFYDIAFREAQKESALSQLPKHYQHYENILAQREGPFYGGASPSMLDFYIWPHLERIAVVAMITDDERLSVKEQSYPSLARWFASMYQLPAVKKLQHSMKAHQEFFQTVKSGKPNYDYGL